MKKRYDILAPIHDTRERDLALAELRRECPVYWDEENQWWLVTRHADVREVSRDPKRFSSEPKGPWHVGELHFSMQAMDGKPHLRHRNVVSRAFTPRMASQLYERAQRYTDEAIDALEGESSTEFVTNLAVPVPMRVIADMLGVADGDMEMFREWSDALILAASGNQDAESMEHSAPLIAELGEYISRKVDERRAQPVDDILSRIVRAADDGILADRPGEDVDVLDSDEAKEMALFLLIAGNETTRNAISQGMLALLQHPEQCERLRADPSLWGTAADEILRWSTPVRAMRRVAMYETELRGQKIREGESVVMVYASANRDESVFDDPHAFRVDRKPNEHVSFGNGPHFCLGANLARMELRAALERILAQLPNMRLADGIEPTGIASPLIDGLETLHVEW